MTSIASVFDGIKNVVLEKNKRYGNSALAPLGVFANTARMADPDLSIATKEILTRLDDKLSRIRNADELRKNDIADLMGYASLLCVACGWTDFSDQVD